MQRISKILIFVLCLSVVAVYAEPNIGFNGIGARLGYVMPEGDVDNTIAFGAVADLGQLSPDIDLEANIIYWSVGEDIGGFDWSWSSFQIDAIAKYKIKMDNSDLKPYVGGGLGLHFGTFKYPSYNWQTGQETDESETETDIAIILAGGAKKTLSETLDGFAELRYSIAGELDTFGFFVGVVYKLNK